MDLQSIIDTLELEVITQPKDFAGMFPTSGYTSDLLSCAMAGARKDGVWITLQSHDNIVAVAALLDLAAIIITEDARPEESTVARANSKNITLLCTSQPTFSIVGKLWEMGLRSE
ncbi:MAG TPA: DRTGG domain-containing protein [Anaerolineaceae bacterium]|nr:DRTGG domain-containing protein [Anaerolineaceae bacterium]